METRIPTPPQLARRFEEGRMTRTQFQAAMSLHADALIEEIVEVKRNPVGAFLDEMMNRRAAAKLLRKHSEWELREVFRALAEERDFPPAHILWNAGHWDIPFHCFIRVAREPVFRIVSFDHKNGLRRLVVEHGAKKKKRANREAFHLARNPESGLFEIARRQKR